jgi:hypothetical protein
VHSYRPGTQTQISQIGARPGTRKLQLFVDNRGGPVGQITMDLTDRLHTGRYHLTRSGGPVQFQYAVGASARTVVPGIVRVSQVKFSRTDRGHERLPAVAFTFELQPKGSEPTYGAIGYLTSTTRRVPGMTTPPVTTGLHATRHGKTAMVRWHASPDIAVHSYVVLAKHGALPAVPWGGGHRVYSGAGHHFHLGHSHAGRPLTLSVFAVDDRGHHSRGRTIVLRR